MNDSSVNTNVGTDRCSENTRVYDVVKLKRFGWQESWDSHICERYLVLFRKWF